MRVIALASDLEYLAVNHWHTSNYVTEKMSLC